jgi:hypothetical protein
MEYRFAWQFHAEKVLRTPDYALLCFLDKIEPLADIELMSLVGEYNFDVPEFPVELSLLCF